MKLASFCLCSSTSSCAILLRLVLSISSMSCILDMTCCTSSRAAAAAAFDVCAIPCASAASLRLASSRSCSGFNTAGNASCFARCCSSASRMSRSSCSCSAIFFLKSYRGAAGRALRSGKSTTSGSPSAAMTSSRRFNLPLLPCSCPKGDGNTSSSLTSSTSSSAAERLLGAGAVTGACTRRDNFGSLAVRGVHRARTAALSVGTLPLSTLISPSAWMLSCVAGVSGCLLGLEVVLKGSRFTPSFGRTFSLPLALQAIHKPCAECGLAMLGAGPFLAT
mmetsp:Transcript_73294/g.136979  ORF Transcript_73294/g.136979 Transcript_73294/m.136979 type:complete len:278 (+) Transcript_73294:2134-2967(+)